MERAVERGAVWVLRVAWAALPFSLGAGLAAALDDRADAVATATAVLLWAGWAAALLAALVPHPFSLTAVRVIAPVAPVVAAGLWVDGRSSPIGAAAAVIACLAAFAPELGIHHVNGPAYPNERRYPLRVPGALLLGPVELAWAFTVGVPAAGALLLAGGETAGLAILPLGVAGAVFAVRALHRLSRRWLVFVPAGVVLHDHLALADAVLFMRRSVRAFEPAPADTDALDLTLGSPGLALQLTTTEPISLGRRVRGRTLGDEVIASSILFTPTRPGRVLREAAERRIG